MADKITFSSATLLGFSRNGKGGKAHFSSSLTQEIQRALAWSEIPDCATGATLEGDLHATTAELVPNEAALKKHSLELDVARCHKFEVIRLELGWKKGKGYRNELRFDFVFHDVRGARKLEEYILTVGEGKSKLTVSYVKQEVLPGAQSEEAA